MALDISKAEYARSKEGTQALINNIEGDIDRVIKAIDGEKYDNLKKIANNNWAGEDKEAFIADLDKKRASVKSSLKKLKNEVRVVLEQDYNNFIKAQKTHYQAK